MTPTNPSGARYESAQMFAQANRPSSSLLLSQIPPDTSHGNGMETVIRSLSLVNPNPNLENAVPLHAKENVAPINPSGARYESETEIMHTEAQNTHLKIKELMWPKEMAWR